MKGKSILIVDDEKNILLTLSQSLETLQLETDTATNGEEALVKLKQKDFGLILWIFECRGWMEWSVLLSGPGDAADIGIIMITLTERLSSRSRR
jgi:CheY-like chemotaxis protein